jgi:hypothetical protein
MRGASIDRPCTNANVETTTSAATNVPPPCTTALAASTAGVCVAASRGTPRIAISAPL